MKNLFLGIIIVIVLFSCHREEVPVASSPVLYFPPLTGNNWDKTDPVSLGWDTAAVRSLYGYLQLKNSKAFIVLKDGKIVVEKYFGSFTQDSLWYWASAAKTLTALLVGIAQQEGLLQLEDKTSKYLGVGWTGMDSAKESLITIRHQITMTSGLDDGVPDDHCTDDSCLTYKADAGNRWAYHNAPYTLLDPVLQQSTGMTINNYVKQKIRDKIGMNGGWLKIDYDNVFFSNARSMARYGLLLLNKGKWNQSAILNDSVYFHDMTHPSQSLNSSYGYLTWLNGQSSYMLPTLQTVFSGMLVPAAAPDMFAALGKNDQKIYVVPSQNMVVIRMGESAGNSMLALSSFDNELWTYINAVTGY